METDELTAADLVPDIGVMFTHKGREYVVDGWLKPSPARPMINEVLGRPDSDLRAALAAVLTQSQRELGPDNVRIEMCPRAEAVYVSGGPCIARIEDITITGMVDWPPAILAEHRESAAWWGEKREPVW